MVAKKILIVGHSHIFSLKKSWENIKKHFADFELLFINLNEKKYCGFRSNGTNGAKTTDRNLLLSEVACFNPDLILMYVNGNQHNISGFNGGGGTPFSRRVKNLKDRVVSDLYDWFGILKLDDGGKFLLMPPPPPIDDEDKIVKFLENSGKISNPVIFDKNARLGFWRAQCEATKYFSEENHIRFVNLPQSVFDEGGFLAYDCYGNDVTHANQVYGERIIRHLVQYMKKENISSNALNKNSDKRQHPYVTLPDHCFWKQSISAVPVAEVDPIVQTRFKIQPKHRVATAGSCFAQHISKRLRNSGFNFFVTEKPDETDTESQARGFYDFSARYGNIYTSRQLLQLFDRAFGYYKPNEQSWSRHGGGYCDPFRPLIEPEGFASPEAVVQDARRHLAAVRRMFKNLDIFVFTLGLTECWTSRLDGAAYPLAPGVAGGAYDPEKHVFVNLGVAEVVADLKLFLQKLKLVNPKARMILTVSPVPLMATAERDIHVLAATTYSKSVLRVAAQEIVNSHDNVYYFPSYEIITGQHVGNGYYAEDRRGVVEQGVDHVMRIFMSHLTEVGQQKTPESSARTLLSHDDAAALAEVERLVQVACDEEMLAK